jgi:hypothetical protein
MELQTGRDGTIEMRLLMYHAGLLLKHGLPVISVILYPFETSIPEPPFREMGGDGEMLTFRYQVLALWKFDTRTFVQEQAVCLYTLLPAAPRHARSQCGTAQAGTEGHEAALSQRAIWTSFSVGAVSPLAFRQGDRRHTNHSWHSDTIVVKCLYEERE